MTPKRNILIIDSDKAFALELAKLVKETLPARITLSPTVREACLHLVQQEQDLAFIPVEGSDQTVRSLRAIQSGLRLILLTPEPDFVVPDHYSGQIQAVLIKPLASIDLPTVFRQANLQPFQSEDDRGGESTAAAPDTAVLIAALQQAQLGQLLQAVIFSDVTRVLAHWGNLNDLEVANVALHVGQEWQQDQYPTRLQFLNLPPRTGERLLYTVHLEQRYLLTLVALPELPLTQLRRHAQQLSGYLTDALNGISTFLPPVNDEADSDQKSYALVWRSLAPLPPTLHIPLRRALERLAAANGCRLGHTAVQQELVHMVVTCPTGYDSDWAAYLFKNGAEEIIQQEFGVTANLWEAGYYATESNEPLSQTELNIFLEPE